MSEFNPYISQIDLNSTKASSTGQLVAQKITINMVDLIRRSWALVRDHYWLFLGIDLVGILIGSAIPFQIILGAMLCGIYLCYQDRDQGRVVEFGQLFKGFDFFLESFLVTLMNAGLMLVFVCCGSLGILVGFSVLLAPVEDGSIELMAKVLSSSMFISIIPATIVALVLSLPFQFAYPLVATRQLTAWDAVKVSFAAVWNNLVSMVWFAIAITMINVALTLMCVVPFVFFLPIYYGCIYLLCSDLFPRGPEWLAV